MIAKFLNESLVVNKNTSLKKFIYSNFPKKVLSDTAVIAIVEGEHGYSTNLTDGKPGGWCIVEWREDSYLFIACSYDLGGYGDFVNSIIVSRFSKEKNSLPCISSYAFLESVRPDTEEAKYAAKFIRKLMHSSQMLAGNYTKADNLIRKESKIFHSWSEMK